MKVGDLVRDTVHHAHWNPGGISGKRTGIILIVSRFLCEIEWQDSGPDRYVSQKDVEVISESR
jgi:hypothetical protein